MRSASSGSGPAAHKAEGYKGSRGLSEPSSTVPPNIPAGLRQRDCSQGSQLANFALCGVGVVI